MQPQNIAATIAALSGPRLNSYRTFFKPADDLELYGIYCWNEAISASLTALLNNLEITMRNAFHRELSARYGATAATASSNWYDDLQLVPRSLEKVRAITHRRRGPNLVPRHPQPSSDDVVSKLTFGFWKHLLDASRDHRGNAVDWGAILTALLPSHGNSIPAYWARQRRQDGLFARIDLVGDMRNRIAHLEPVWKTGPLLEEGRARPNYTPTTVQPAPATPPDAIARLKLVHNRAYELLYWLSAARANDHRQSAAWGRFRHLASADGLDGFKKLTAGRRIPFMGLRTLVRSGATVGGMIEVTDGQGVVVALLFPHGV